MEDITYDLVSGGVLDLAELYAADCLGSQAEQAVEDFLRFGPEPVRHQFFLRVAQAREALLLAYGSLHANPPSDLLPRILAQLPVPPPTTKRKPFHCLSPACAPDQAQDRNPLDAMQNQHRDDERPSGPVSHRHEDGPAWGCAGSRKFPGSNPSTS
ncbi:hypothetical protein GCM10007170_46170 [Arthrobacter liuii]|uniref:Uncharacterized protein n=1 Tax=Arthrobacter liuii TaxID=1476996 RepID=A0ABQ2B1V4_9MICC|nr:hypothetical protein GCM10007170_46170 [Arthrobacter liuii]